MFVLFIYTNFAQTDVNSNFCQTLQCHSVAEGAKV